MRALAGAPRVKPSRTAVPSAVGRMRDADGPSPRVFEDHLAGGLARRDKASNGKRSSSWPLVFAASSSTAS